MYKTLYRSMILLLTIVSLFYLGFGFIAYTDAQTQILSNTPPSVFIQQQRESAAQYGDKNIDLYIADQYALRPGAPSDDVDTIWQTGLYIQLAQGIVTFSLALATAIFALFALANHKRFAILATSFLPLAYLSDEIFSFVRHGIYGLGTYNIYIFNILEIMVLVTLLAMCIFTISRFYRKTTPSEGVEQS